MMGFFFFFVPSKTEPQEKATRVLTTQKLGDQLPTEKECMAYEATLKINDRKRGSRFGRCY